HLISINVIFSSQGTDKRFTLSNHVLLPESSSILLHSTKQQIPLVCYLLIPGIRFFAYRYLKRNNIFIRLKTPNSNHSSMELAEIWLFYSSGSCVVIHWIKSSKGCLIPTSLR